MTLIPTAKVPGCDREWSVLDSQFQPRIWRYADPARPTGCFQIFDKLGLKMDSSHHLVETLRDHECG